MCYPTTCSSCSKTTWAGCGQHSDQVMAGVPKARRCTCTPAPDSGSGFFRSLFGR
ncbi:hypothetical protein SZ00_03315 [Rhodococcus sp. AD45]|nr:hypothetical protein SZ00_03315 [Rhodococcus sp. AD45]